MSKTCDRCGQPTRTVYPVMAKAPAKAADMDSQPLSRLALYALGVPEPVWGDHPDDDMFETWCEDCVTREEQATR